MEQEAGGAARASQAEHSAKELSFCSGRVECQEGLKVECDISGLHFLQTPICSPKAEMRHQAKQSGAGEKDTWPRAVEWNREKWWDSGNAMK